MKKYLTLFFVFVLFLSLTGCGRITIDDLWNNMITQSGDIIGTSKAGQENSSDTKNNSPPSEDIQAEDTSATDKVIYDGYEMEEVFTIYVNGSEEWTPFPSESDVFFAVDDEEIVSISDDGTTVRFTGEQVGETMLGARAGEVDLFALVRVRAMDGSAEIDYHYNPPEDNYYIAFEHIYEDGDVDSEVFARIGRQYMYSYDTTYSFSFVDFGAEVSYDREPGGPWMHDPEGLGLDMEGDWSKPPLPLSAMEEYFMDTFYALGGEVSRLAEYYVGNETLYPIPYETTGIDCWVFDIRGFNGNYLKFWIDPSNGCCLKYEDTEDGDYTVVTEYNLNHTAWDNSPQ